MKEFMCKLSTVQPQPLHKEEKKQRKQALNSKNVHCVTLVLSLETSSCPIYAYIGNVIQSLEFQSQSTKIEQYFKSLLNQEKFILKRSHMERD